MVYRIPLLAATIALFGSFAQAAEHPKALAIVEVGSKSAESAGARDWSELFSVRADLGGGTLLVEAGAAADRMAESLGAARPLTVAASDEPALYVISGMGAVEASLLPTIGAILWREGDEALVQPRHEEDAWALAGSGVRLLRVPAHEIKVAASASIGSAAAPDYPVVDEIVAKITAADISSFDTSLVGFGTRYANQQGGLDAQAWLVSQFQSFGLTQIDQQPVPNIQQKNVCATLPGTTTPDRILVVGGHFDSVTSNTANAPGADDNGSGTSGMLAVAKTLAGYHFQSTIVFCGYAGEELGLLGSAVHAQSLAGSNVVGMINLDMIGYLEPGDAMDIDVQSNGASASMRSQFADVVTRYVPSAAQVNGQIPAGASSDHASFWQEGFPALMLFEDTGNYSPYIHTTQDTIGTSFNSPTLAEETTRGAAALLAVMAVPDTGAGTPTPTPNPTATPGGQANGDGTVHGGCACDLGGVDSPVPLPSAALLAAALVLAWRRRAARPMQK